MVGVINTEVFRVAVEEIMREMRVCGAVAAAVMPPEHHNVSAVCLRANGFDLEV